MTVFSDCVCSVGHNDGGQVSVNSYAVLDVSQYLSELTPVG